MVIFLPYFSSLPCTQEPTRYAVHKMIYYISSTATTVTSNAHHFHYYFEIGYLRYLFLKSTLSLLLCPAVFYLSVCSCLHIFPFFFRTSTSNNLKGIESKKRFEVCESHTTNRWNILWHLEPEVILFPPTSFFPKNHIFQPAAFLLSFNIIKTHFSKFQFFHLNPW